MNTKTCLNCGESFMPKRSDATCCSDKCRSAYNYKKKQRQDINSTLPNIFENVQNVENDVIIKGEIDTKFLIDKTKECEIKMGHIYEQISLLETNQTMLYAQILEFNKQILDIEATEKAKLLKLNALSDLTLYNNYLNENYLSDKLKGSNLAHHRLKSESDINSSHNPKPKIDVEIYRNKIAYLISQQDLKIESKNQQIISITNETSQHSAKIKELYIQLRFYEARLLKYEALLLSV